MWVLRRSFWLALAVAGLGWLIQSAILQVAEERDNRTFLLEVQQALQDYHVEQERYVPRLRMSGYELLGVLADFGNLEQMPNNPWSGEIWKLDGEEPDRLVYETDPAFETYSLKIMDSAGIEVVMELDSESNPSLE